MIPVLPGGLSKPPADPPGPGPALAILCGLAICGLATIAAGFIAVAVWLCQHVRFQ